MALPPQREPVIKPPFNEAPIGANGDHSAAWAAYHQQIADVLAGLGTGVTDGSDAKAGKLGEYISANLTQGAAVALTTGVAANITHINLTAGDWDVSGTVQTSPGGGTIEFLLQGSVSIASATLQGSGGFAQLMATTAAGASQALATGTRRVSVAAPTTVYLVAQASFGSGAMGAFGFLAARRMR